MKGKYLIIGLLLLILFNSAFGLSVTTDKNDYIKGDAIEISGSCNPLLSNELITTYGEKKVFEKGVECSSLGNYSLKYDISLVDPAGNWIIKLLNEEESFVKKIVVSRSPESAYYLIRFLSPSIGKYRKIEDIALSVKVTDAGVVVEDASVVCWDLDGNRLYLENKGNGSYFLQYEIPYNSEAEEWDLLVIAASEKGGEWYGGENRISLAITNAPITIDVIEPAIQSFELTATIPIKAGMTYFNGKEIKEEKEELKAVAEINGKNYELEKTEGGIYQINYKPGPEDLGTTTISLSAEDDAGNKGNKTIDLVITCSLGCLMTTYGIYVLAFLVIGGIILAAFYGRITHGVRLRVLQKERKKTFDLIKALQKEYFDKGVMPYRSYKKNLADYQTRIAELDEKIKNLKKGEGEK